MGLLRLIIWGTILYLIFNAARNILKTFVSAKPKDDNAGVKQQPKQSKYNIEKDDVIDAHFEEIEKPDNQKENS